MFDYLNTLGLLKRKVFWNKGYDVIISVHDVTNKILSHASNYDVDVVMWPRSGTSSISLREVIIISILKGQIPTKSLFWGLIKFNNLGLALGMALKLHKCGKRVETKNQKCFEANSYVCRSFRGKTGRGPFWPLPTLNRDKLITVLFLRSNHQ